MVRVSCPSYPGRFCPRITFYPKSYIAITDKALSTTVKGKGRAEPEEEDEEAELAKLRAEMAM